MTKFGTDFQTGAWPALSSVFGATYSHTPPGGSAENFTGIWLVTSEDVQHDDDEEVTTIRGDMSVLESDLTSFVKGSVFTISTKPYAVDEITERSPMLVLSLKNRTVKRVGGAMTRRPR